MFIVYYSNQLEKQKEILSSLFKSLPPEDPFQQDIILVQSPGMAQWLQIELAKETGISANLKISYASKFYLATLCSELTRNGIEKPF